MLPRQRLDRMEGSRKAVALLKIAYTLSEFVHRSNAS